MKKLILLLAFVLTASCAFALPTGSLVDWTGSKDFSFAGSDGRMISGRVDFAVYAPSSFPLVPAESGYVYAYQIFSDTCSDKGISSFSLAMSQNADAVSIGFDDTFSPGIDPSFSFFSPTQTAPDSADFLFLPKTNFAGLINPSDNSAILYFISMNAPTDGFGHLDGGGVGGTVESLPTPVPEPTTLALMSLSMAFILRKKK